MILFIRFKKWTDATNKSSTKEGSVYLRLIFAPQLESYDRRYTGNKR